MLSSQLVGDREADHRDQDPDLRSTLQPLSACLAISLSGFLPLGRG